MALRLVVYAKKPLAGPRPVFEYLARYTHRVALTTDRLPQLRDDVVSMRWRDYAHGNKKKVLRLDTLDLLRRFMLHVLPRGFCRIRHYGLLANRHKGVKLECCRRYFGTVAASDPVDPILGILQRIGIYPDRCASCGSPKISRELVLPPPRPRARAPTRALAEITPS